MDRAQGCLVGRLAGDALGSLVEFKGASWIAAHYPGGVVRDLHDGGSWDTVAGQPTDDSEMALLLARMLVRNGTYSSAAALEEYRWWLASNPFDIGGTYLRSPPGQDADGESSQWSDEAGEPPGALLPLDEAIALAVRVNLARRQLNEAIRTWAQHLKAEPLLVNCIEKAASEPPRDFVTMQGWVLIAFALRSTDCSTR